MTHFNQLHTRDRGNHFPGCFINTVVTPQVTGIMIGDREIQRLFKPERPLTYHKRIKCSDTETNPPHGLAQQIPDDLISEEGGYGPAGGMGFQVPFAAQVTEGTVLLRTLGEALIPGPYNTLCSCRHLPTIDASLLEPFLQPLFVDFAADFRCFSDQ